MKIYIFKKCKKIFKLYFKLVIDKKWVNLSKEKCSNLLDYLILIVIDQAHKLLNHNIENA